MKKQNLAWILGGGAVFAGATIFLAACSDDPILPIKDAGKDSTVTPDTGTDAKPNTDGATPDGGDSGAVCFSKLRPNADAGPFCYFIPKANDAGNGINCGTGQTCCYGAPKGGDAGFDPSVCVTGNASACPAPSVADASPGNALECAEKDDCPTNQVCCIVAVPTNDGGVTVGVDQFTCNFAKNEIGTRCKATCGAGDLQGCQSDSECNGKTCVQVDVGTGDRLQMGYCK